MTAAAPQRGHRVAPLARTLKMIELIRTNDLVVINVVETLLREDGIAFFVADNHVSAVEGGIGAFQRRVLVRSDHASRARRIIAEAGLEAELRDG